MRRNAIKYLLIIFCFSGFAQNIDVQLLKKHVYTLANDSLQGRGFGTSGARVAADYVVGQFVQAGISPWNGSYKHPFINSRMMLKTEGCNIIGWVEGADPVLKDEFIVIGAHYDHVGYVFEEGKRVVYNGADDNASGTATVIEVGRWLVQNRSLLKRSVILVAFDGEEAGLIGSTFMVKNNQIPIDKVKAMFSLDMVGMLSKYDGLDLVGNATLNNGEFLLNGIAEKHGIKIKNEGKRVEMQTDTSPFGKVGIPAVHVFTSTVSPYHKPEDDAELLDYDGMQRISEFMKDVAVHLSNQDALVPDSKFLASVSGKRFKPKFGFKFGFGSANIDYQDEFYYGKTIFAYNAGFYSQIRLSNVFSLQPELLYQSRGSEHAWGILRTHEFTVPLNCRIRLFSVMEDMFENQLFFAIGPYYSYRFEGKVGANKMDFDNDFNREDIGVQLGFGFDIMNTQLLIVSSISLKSVSKHSDLMQQSSIFSLGFRF